MNVSKLIEEQSKTFSGLDRKLTSKPTASMVAKLGKATQAAQVTRIDARIARLEAQKKTVVARLDYAIKREREALELIRSERQDLPFDEITAKPGRKGNIARKTGAKSAALRGGKKPVKQVKTPNKKTVTRAKAPNKQAKPTRSTRTKPTRKA